MLKIFIDSNIQVIVRMALADPGGRGGLGVATPPNPSMGRSEKHKNRQKPYTLSGVGKW